MQKEPDHENYPGNQHYGFYVEHPEIPEKVKVEYNGCWSKANTSVVHFQLYSQWTSPTGYRSHFTFRPILKEFNDCAHDYAFALVDRLFQARKEGLSQSELAELRYGVQQSLF